MTGSIPELGAPRRGPALAWRWLTTLLVATCLLGCLLAPAAASAQQQGAPRLDAASWTLVDLDDGTVLASHRSDQQRSMASTTKLMTAYVARRELELDDLVTAPPYAGSAVESLLGLQAGERISVRDLHYGLLLVSGNDAAEALAIASAGSVPSFAEQMNAAARELGLDDTSYVNPIGLDEPGHYTTASDLAVLGEEILGDRFLSDVVASETATLRSGARTRRLRNTNELLQRNEWVDGVKTGYTLEAGYVLVASGERRGADLLSVVMGAPSEAARDAETLELLDYGFSQYERRTPVEAGERLAAAEVAFQGERLALEAASEVSVAARDDERIELRLDRPGSVEGPIERGQRLGRALVTLDGQPVEHVALLASRSVEEASAVERLDASIPGGRAVLWVLLALAALAVVCLVALVLRPLMRR